MTLPANSLRGVELNRPFSIWLPHDNFQPFPSPASIFPATRVATAAGSLTFCIPFDARLEGRTPPIGLIYIQFDPSTPGTPDYPFDTAIATARELRLLRESQQSLMRAAASDVEANHRRLLSALREFSLAPHETESRRLVEAISQIHQLRSVDPGTFVPAEFLDRSQREVVRAHNALVEGRCLLDVRVDRVTVELRACSWQQLARTWNGYAGRVGSNAGTLTVRHGFESGESPDLTLSMATEGYEGGHRLLVAVLASLPGLELQNRTPQ